jgi:hypothetical protein
VRVGLLLMRRGTVIVAFALCALESGELCLSQISPHAQEIRDKGNGFGRLSQPQSTGKPSRQRFLGWRYGALAGQNSARWVRPSGSGIGSQAEATQAARTLQAEAGPATSFPSAGFKSPAELSTGFLPTAVVQGDFNADGKMDVAISNGGDNTIYVYLGNGDGTFAVPEVLYTSGQSPAWLAAAQLKTGGHVDLIAVDGDSQKVEVFSGNGDGTFKASSVVATLSQIPTFVLSGDFNKDGHVDLAVGLVVDAGTVNPQFQVLLGDGTGSFPSAITPPPVDNSAGSGPLSTDWMAAGDLNNDGLMDLVTTVAFRGAVTYLNRGGKSFSQGAVFNPEDTAVAVGLGDMDGDGCIDALQTGVWGFLSIAKGNCDGTFTQNGPTAELGDVDVAITATDVNGDGKLDVVASSAFSDAEIYGGGPIGAYGGYLVSVLLGDGKGNLAPAEIYRTGAEAYSLVLSDLKGTGRPDIVTISQTEHTASVLLNDGKGGFGSPSGETIGYLSGVTNAPIPSGEPQTFDVNGDGKPDVLLIEFGQNATMPSLVTTLLNDGTGKLGAPIRSPINVGPTTPYPLFVAGRFRSVSPADLIYVNLYSAPGVAFIPGNGDGTFGSAVSLATLPSPYQMASGDFNADAKLDFAVFGYASVNSSATMELDVFLGNGDGTFKHLPAQTFPALAPPSDVPSQLIAGDFNHDGALDLLIDNSGVDLDLALGNGDGTFRTPSTLESNFGPPVVADFNHDGYLDLAQPEDPDANTTENALITAGGPFSVPAATVYLGGPGGTFTKQGTYSMAGVLGTPYLLLGDFNGDGNPDLALPYFPATIGRPWNMQLEILQGNGDGTFTPGGIPHQLPAYDRPVVGGDYRGVGVTDLLDLVGATSSINTLAAGPVPALAITADSSPLTGLQGSATVRLALPPSSAQTVQLSSSDAAVTLPGSLSFAKGEIQHSFTFTVGSGFDSSHVLAVTAELAGQTATAYFAKANSNLHPSVTATIGSGLPAMTSTAASPGNDVALLLTVQSLSGYSGTFGKFFCSGLPPGAQCNFAQSSVVLLPGGFAQVAFDLTTTTATPIGSYRLTIGASNGEISPSALLEFGVGEFSLTANPMMIQWNGSGPPTTTLTAAYNNFSQGVQVTCTGLPAGASCNVPGVLFPSSLSMPVTLSALASVAAQDYPFVIAGRSGSVTGTVNAILRVSGFRATLATTSATIAKGMSATFNVNLQSLNHFSNDKISFSCQSSAIVACTAPAPYVSLGDAASTTVLLTVIPSSTASTPVFWPFGGFPWQTSLALILLSLNPRSRIHGKWPQRFWLGGWLFLLGTITACGGGSAGTGGVPGPTSHTITVSVSAQAPTGSGTLQQDLGTLTLTITD